MCEPGAGAAFRQREETLSVESRIWGFPRSPKGGAKATPIRRGRTPGLFRCLYSPFLRRVAAHALRRRSRLHTIRTILIIRQDLQGNQDAFAFESCRIERTISSLARIALIYDVVHKSLEPFKSPQVRQENASSFPIKIPGNSELI